MKQTLNQILWKSNENLTFFPRIMEMLNIEKRFSTFETSATKDVQLQDRLLSVFAVKKYAIVLI